VLGRKLGWRDLEFVFDDLEVFDERAQAELDEILLRSDVLLPDEVRLRRRMLPLANGQGQLTYSERRNSPLD